VTKVSLGDLNAANARTLATFCTGLRVLDIGLEALKTRAPGASFHRTTTTWLKAQGADAVLAGVIVMRPPRDPHVTAL
jgi:hypothetical protein